MLDVARRCGVSVLTFVADEPRANPVDDMQVCAAAEFDFAKAAPFSFIVGIGDNAVRQRLFLKLKESGEPFTLRHPLSFISQRTIVGKGTVIMPSVVVNTGATIHDNVILNTSCSIDHDCVIGAHSHICPGVHLAGGVKVGAGTMIGTGSAVIPGVTIGENCTIGAGSVVVRDIPSGSVAYGSPCRVQSASSSPKV